VSVAFVAAVTWVVVTANVAVVAPAATKTVAGTLAAELELERLTVIPVGPAAPLSVTVPVTAVEDPPMTEVGATEKADKVAGVTVRTAPIVVEPSFAETVADFFAETAEVVIVNVPEVAPAAMIRLAGTAATVVLELSAMFNPPVGAAPLMVTVPVEEDPPWTDVGFTLIALRTGGLIVSGA
jgi:hypothetical protein